MLRRADEAVRALAGCEITVHLLDGPAAAAVLSCAAAPYDPPDPAGAHAAPPAAVITAAPAEPIQGQSAFSLRGALEQLPIGSTATLGILALLTLGVAACLLLRPARPRLDFALAVAASIALSSYLNAHDLVLLLAPLALLSGLLLDGELRRPWLGWPVLAFSYVSAGLYLELGAAPAAAGVIALAAYLLSERLTPAGSAAERDQTATAARRPSFAGPDESRLLPPPVAPSRRAGPRGEPRFPPR